MSVPCCISNWPYPGFRCENVPDEQHCMDVPGDSTPGLPGARCSETGGCWQCPTAQVTVDCCFPGQVHLTGVDYDNCIRCGGRAIPADECIEVYPEPECHAPREDRNPASGLRWTIDLVDEVAFGLSDQTGDRGEVIARTNRLTRAIGPLAEEAEPCAQFESKFVMLDNGEVAVHACSQPVGFDPSSRRGYFAGLMTVQGEGYDNGAQYMVGRVHLPYWTEAIVRSHRWLCGSWLE